METIYRGEEFVKKYEQMKKRIYTDGKCRREVTAKFFFGT